MTHSRSLITTSHLLCQLIAHPSCVAQSMVSASSVLGLGASAQRQTVTRQTPGKL